MPTGGVVTEVVPWTETGWSNTMAPTLTGTVTDTAAAVPAKPLASMAWALSWWVPGANAGTVVAHGASVSTGPIGAPSSRYCRLVMLTVSLTEACRVTGPVSVVPATGLVSTTTGLVAAGVTCCRTVTVVPVILSCVSVTERLGPDWAK